MASPAVAIFLQLSLWVGQLTKHDGSSLYRVYKFFMDQHFFVDLCRVYCEFWCRNHVSSVLGYLATGILIGPYGLSMIRNVHAKLELFLVFQHWP
uniref:K(+) efflux antiporter 2, chloroplastic n=1 Tax=Noccaea caerulescens TaxID=107243 RepID=A0A1J3JP09_NOCCA